jgi:hypothetical protein
LGDHDDGISGGIEKGVGQPFDPLPVFTHLDTAALRFSCKRDLGLLDSLQDAVIQDLALGFNDDDFGAGTPWDDDEWVAPDLARCCSMDHPNTR